MTDLEIKKKVISYLKGTGWDIELAHYWESQTFLDCINKLQQYVEEEKLFIPEIGIVFRFLKECPFSSIKTVIFIDDDFNNLTGHTGIPYSQNTKIMKKPEFPKHADERICIRKEVSFFLCYLTMNNRTFNYDLTRWCNQGVLMLPYALTTRLNGLPHYNLWKELRIRIIDIINIQYPKIPWVLVGERAIKMEDVISSKNIQLFEVSHTTKPTFWFDNVNNTLKNNNQEPINWLGT